MSAKKIKRKRSSRELAEEQNQIPNYPGELLFSFRLPNDPEEAAAIIHFYLFKFTFLEDGRLLGRKRSNDHFETVLGLQSPDSFERLLRNFEQQFKFPLTRYAVQSGEESRSKLLPIAHLMSNESNEMIAKLASHDPDLIEAHLKGIAERMDTQGPSGDFVFPDLTPEQYEAISRMSAKKPN